jgi:hypothetical protein
MVTANSKIYLIPFKCSKLMISKDQPHLKNELLEGTFIDKTYINISNLYIGACMLHMLQYQPYNDKTIYVDVQITEPLLMSPFIFVLQKISKGFMVSLI